MRSRIGARAQVEVDRNLHPHAEAILAMNAWGIDYASQPGGCMDFWDKLDEGRKRWSKHAVDMILAARRA